MPIDASRSRDSSSSAAPRAGRRDEWAHVDARRQFQIDVTTLWDDAPPTLVQDCICGDIMAGIKSPTDCTLFGKQCVPHSPVGACMVSSEGTCKIWHQYGGHPVNDRISCIDVLYDVAFLLRDLWRLGLHDHANVLFNDYMTKAGTLDALALMPLFLSCRAAVRAKTNATAVSASARATRSESARGRRLPR